MSVQTMKDYLDAMGVLACNVNPYLPAVEDIGCRYTDVMELMDRKEVFTCKVYRKRTVYLSKECYYLLKACRKRPSMPQNAALLYSILEQGPWQDKKVLKKKAVTLGPKEFDSAFDFLFSNLHMTAVGGEWLNPNWFTYRFGTARAWEGEETLTLEPQGAEARLRTILGRSLSEKEIFKFF